jgi:hypothetical protein
MIQSKSTKELLAEQQNNRYSVSKMKIPVKDQRSSLVPTSTVVKSNIALTQFMSKPKNQGLMMNASSSGKIEGLLKSNSKKNLAEQSRNNVAGGGSSSKLGQNSSTLFDKKQSLGKIIGSTYQDLRNNMKSQTSITKSFILVGKS